MMILRSFEFEARGGKSLECDLFCQRVLSMTKFGMAHARFVYNHHHHNLVLFKSSYFHSSSFFLFFFICCCDLSALGFSLRLKRETNFLCYWRHDMYDSTINNLIPETFLVEHLLARHEQQLKRNQQKQL